MTSASDSELSWLAKKGFKGSLADARLAYFNSPEPETVEKESVNSEPDITENTKSTLVVHDGLKQYFVKGTANSNGDISLHFDEAEFSTIWFITAIPDGAAVYVYCKSQDLKSAVYTVYKPNPATIVQGLNYNPFVTVGAGTVVNFKVEGI